MAARLVPALVPLAVQVEVLELHAVDRAEDEVAERIHVDVDSLSAGNADDLHDWSDVSRTMSCWMSGVPSPLMSVLSDSVTVYLPGNTP